MKTALIGLGMVAGTCGDAIRNSAAVSLAGVHARSLKTRNAFLADWPELGIAAASSIDAIADDPDIGFVILATPPNARAEIVERMVAAGKPGLMEKPVERTLAAATAVVESCESAGVPLGIMLQHRVRPAVAELKRQIAGLGDLMAVEINVPWWRPQSYYDGPRRGSYDRDGGGVLTSQAIHTLDLAIAIAGPVAEAGAMAVTTGFHEMESEDFVSAGPRFESGAVGRLFAGTAGFPGARRDHHPAFSQRLGASRGRHGAH